MTKVCSKCKQEKDIEQFNKCKNSKDGYSYICKQCQHEYDEARKDKKKEYTKQHSLEKREYYNKYNKEHREEKLKYNKEHNEKQKQYCRDYRLKNIEKLQFYDRERNKVRGKDVAYRLQSSISGLMYYSLRNNKSNIHWEDLVPYNLKQLKKYLENQFDDKMNWGNMGSYWEIDHIIPRNTFKDLTKAENRDFQICWSLLNLRPLEKSANRSRPKDGRDIPQEIKDKILGQDIQSVILNVEKGGSVNG